MAKLRGGDRHRGISEAVQRQPVACREGTGLQVPVRGDQAQRLAGFGSQAPGLVEEASADPAAAGDAAHAKVRQLPGVVARAAAGRHPAGGR